MSKAVAVILCGGFKEVGTPALALVDHKKACMYMLAAMEEVKRLQPLCSSVFWVINECDKQAFVNSLLDDIGGSYGFNEANFISNGATQKDAWKSDVADLQLALHTIGSSGPVIAVSGSLTFAPGYNLQRLVEHSFIRGHDAVGFHELSDADVVLLGPAGHTEVQIASNIPQPPLSALAPAGDSPCVGTYIAEPLLFLRPSTLSSPAVMESSASGLVELASSLISAGHKVHGADMGFGRLRLDTAACVSYADALIKFMKLKMRPVKSTEIPGYAEPVITTHQAFSGIFDDKEKLAANMAEFESLHFGWQTPAGAELMMSGQATMKEFYRLPSTFYMTAYRRQVAELMR